MTYKRDSTALHEQVDLSATISSALHSKQSTVGKVKNNLKSSSGSSYGEIELPAAAELVFPALDDLAAVEGGEAEGKRKNMKKSKVFVEEYFDRRARAKFVSITRTTPSSIQFPLLPSLFLVQKQANG